jgi:adenylate kinase family enzyme
MEDMEKILENYQSQLLKIDGTKSVEEVFSEIKDSLA